jgi:hypothetical protein
MATYVGRCEVCDRVTSSFNSLSPQLQPLPIMGLGYHWSLDFAGPLVVTSRGAKYVLVMVEHFSKWIELVALSQNSAELAVAAFLDRVLARFGAPAEVLTDQGREFLGAFEELCTKALIDHRTTSRDHPEADGLAERVVQTTKRGLRNNGLLRGNHWDWDLMLSWTAMGYRFSRQASLTSYSPYQLLYGCEPILPSSIREKLAPVVDLDDPNVWAECLQERAQFFQRAMPMAMENLSIAQHRDTSRYARIRSGAYRPQLRRFRQGDYVYLQCEAPTTLDVKAGRTILRMKECCRVVCCCWKARMAGNVVSILKIVPRVIYPLRIQFILNSPSCQRAFHVLCMGRRKERLLCSCVISVNVVGTWHA